MNLVPDAGLVVAALVDDGPLGRDAIAAMGMGDLAAPHLMPVEVAGVLRRAVAAGKLSADAAATAHADMMDLPVQLFGYAPFAQRIWELRSSVTPYDAWYVAVAEELDARLATVDARLSRAHGPRCGFLVLDVRA